MTEALKVLPEGTMIRVTKQSPCDPTELAGQAVTGHTYRVYGYAAADSPDNDDASGKGYYTVDSEGSYGGTRWVYPEDLEVTQTVSELAARELPTLLEVSKATSSALHSLWGSDAGFEITETSIGTDDPERPYVYASGKTDSGLRFGLKLAVLEIYSEEDY